MTERIVYLDRSAIRTAVRRPAIVHEWIEYPTSRPEEVKARLKGATIAITHRMFLRNEDLPSTLRLIVVGSTGYERIDLAACRVRRDPRQQCPRLERLSFGARFRRDEKVAFAAPCLLQLLPSGRHVRHGVGQGSGGGRRIARSRHRRAADCRRLGHANDPLGEHRRADRHDRGIRVTVAVGRIFRACLRRKGGLHRPDADAPSLTRRLGGILEASPHRQLLGG